MLFVNHTPLPAALIPCAEGGDDMTVLAVAAVTCAIGAEHPGGLHVVREQRAVERGNERVFPGDDHFIREGVSVTASGYVYAPDGKGTRADASLEVGEEKRLVRVFGPRVWQEGVFGALSPTAPRPFDRVPMSWELAYGGAVLRKTSVVKHEGREYIAPEHPVASPYNVEGMGFYLERGDAIEKPLPQLEHPDEPIRAWDDRPKPVCFAPYPLDGGMRPLALLSGEKYDLNRMGRLTSRAAPWLVFSSIAPGTPVTLRGMRPKGQALSFVVPEAPVSLRVILGRALFRLEARLDAIDIDAEQAEARFVFRCPFRFGLVQNEQREVHLEGTEAFLKLGAAAPLDPRPKARQKV